MITTPLAAGVKTNPDFFVRFLLVRKRKRETGTGAVGGAIIMSQTMSIISGRRLRYAATFHTLSRLFGIIPETFHILSTLFGSVAETLSIITSPLGTITERPNIVSAWH